MSEVKAEETNELFLASWNVDGLRGDKPDDPWPWLKSYVDYHRPHVFALNETKRGKEDLERYFRQLGNDYTWLLNVHTPSCMHGVGMLIRKDVTFEPIELKFDCPKRSDTLKGDATTGRVLAIRIPGRFEKDKPLHVVAVYAPNSGVDAKKPLKHLDYRMAWDKSLHRALNELRAKGPVILMGDINVAPTDQDVSDPTGMSKCAGFTPQERESLAIFLSTPTKDTWIDAWRYFHPLQTAYTCRGRDKKRWTGRYGRRLDNILVSCDLIATMRVKETFMATCDASSDHIPIGIVIDMPAKAEEIIMIDDLATPMDRSDHVMLWKEATKGRHAGIMTHLLW